MPYPPAGYVIEVSDPVVAQGPGVRLARGLMNLINISAPTTDLP